MVEANQQYAYFSIADGFDPAEITAELGVAPSESWRRGDICPQRHLERKFSRWMLCSRMGREQELEAHIRDVLAQLDSNPEGFLGASLKFGGVLQLVGYFYKEYPGLHFDREITAGISRFALAVDFDFYGLYSHRREDT